MGNAFDIGAWLDAHGWTGEARDQARLGFNAGWFWATADELGMPNALREEAISAGNGTYSDGFNMGTRAHRVKTYSLAA